jgi:hypothetical protein
MDMPCHRCHILFRYETRGSGQKPVECHTVYCNDHDVLQRSEIYSDVLVRVPD